MTEVPEPYYTLNFTQPCPTCTGTLAFADGQQEPHECTPPAAPETFQVFPGTFDGQPGAWVARVA